MIRSLRCTCFQLSVQPSNPVHQPVHACSWRQTTDEFPLAPATCARLRCASGYLLKVLTSEYVIALLHSPQTEDTDGPAPSNQLLDSRKRRARVAAVRSKASTQRGAPLAVDSIASAQFKINWTLWGRCRRSSGIISAGPLSECRAYVVDTWYRVIEF